MANDRLEEILTFIHDTKRGYDFASIHCAIVKDGEDWKSYVTKITLRRRKKREHVSFSFTTDLERPNFLIFRRNVSIEELGSILKDLFDLDRFTIDGYEIYSEGFFDQREFFHSTKMEDFHLEWPADGYFYRIRKDKPSIPKNLQLKRNYFLDAYDAIRQLVGFKYFDQNYYTHESLFLFLPLYFVKISRCEMNREKLVFNIKSYDEKINLKNAYARYYYGKETRGQSRGELSPVESENEVALDYAPEFVTVLLFFAKFEDPLDEYELYLARDYERPGFFAGVRIKKLPDMFRELEGVINRAGFKDAKAKIVMAAATNLIEVVVTKKLMDLGADIPRKLNDKISRVVEEIEQKEERNIRKELMPYILKVSRDKADHAGFDLYIRDEDALFLLKRTIDFLHQLYE